jgi:hypothetical protein
MVLYATNKNLIIFKLLQPLFKKAAAIYKLLVFLY